MIASGSNSNSPPLLEARGILKTFPGVRALQNVDATFYPGEVHAVVGENGAGKSTLMKVIGGIHLPDDGEVLVDGQPEVIDSVGRATELGIAFIHQELNLADNLSIGANVFLGREPKKAGPLGMIDNKQIHEETEVYLKQLDFKMPSTTLVRDLSIGQQQIVEIAKALSQNARLIIMDEPTSSLTQHETDRLFEVIAQLKSQNVCIAYISHRLTELTQMADTATVLKDGENSGELTRDQMTHENLVSLMVGREVSEFYKKTERERGEVLLEVEDLVVPGQENHPLNFEIHAGEIVGMAGLVGAGRTELSRVLFGIDQAVSGTIKVAGKSVSIRSPQDAIANGIALVPEDRKQQGLILELSVKDNTILAGLDRYQKSKFTQHSKLREVSDAMVDKLLIKTPTIDQEVQLLSGGNQQKVVLGKWISLGPRILLLDEPTRGIDVMAKEEIYRLMEQMAKEGVGILMISSEMEEVLGMSDRILVMHEGEIAGNLEGDAISEEGIMRLATGAK